MGKLSNNILGPVSGRVGNVVGSSWRGIPYIKSVYSARTKNISDKEKANRQKFQASQRWLGYLVDFVREGYRGYTPTVQGFVAAKSYLMKHAMEWVNGQWRVNPALMKVSFGTLPNSENITVHQTETGDLQFSWNATGIQGGYSNDQVMLLAYDVTNERVTSKIAGALRSTGTDTLSFTRKKGDTCHVWVAFVARDRSRQSESIYLGEIEFV